MARRGLRTHYNAVFACNRTERRIGNIREGVKEGKNYSGTFCRIKGIMLLCRRITGLSDSDRNPVNPFIPYNFGFFVTLQVADSGLKGLCSFVEGLQDYSDFDRIPANPFNPYNP